MVASRVVLYGTGAPGATVPIVRALAARPAWARLVDLAPVDLPAVVAAEIAADAASAASPFAGIPEAAFPDLAAAAGDICTLEEILRGLPIRWRTAAYLRWCRTHASDPIVCRDVASWAQMTELRAAGFVPVVVDAGESTERLPPEEDGCLRVDGADPAAAAEAVARRARRRAVRLPGFIR